MLLLYKITTALNKFEKNHSRFLASILFNWWEQRALNIPEISLLAMRVPWAIGTLYVAGNKIELN